MIHPLRNNGGNGMGFTIVEVMIVMAIAGLIMLITFEAVPALTRSSRNNSRKQDATAILQAVSSYELNHTGDFPTSCGNPHAACNTGAGSLLYYAKLTYYDATNANDVIVTDETQTTAPPSIAAPASFNVIKIYDYEKCVNGVQNSATNQGADYSNTVALWADETATGTVGMCQQL